MVVFNGIVCALPVDFWLTLNMSLRLGFLKVQDGALVGGVWLFPSGIASDPLSTLIEHLWLHQPHPYDRSDEVGVPRYLVPSYVFDIIVISIQSFMPPFILRYLKRAVGQN